MDITGMKTTDLKTICTGSDNTLEVMDLTGEVILTIGNEKPNPARSRTIAVRKDQLLDAIDDGEYIRIRKSDLPEVAVVDGYWQVSWGRETTREEGPESFRDDALLALAQSVYAAEHPEDL